MIHPLHLRRSIFETLNRMGEPFNSPSAVELLMLTSAHESHLGTYLWQYGAHEAPTGPGIGIYSMEPRTHDSLWDDHLRFRPLSRDAVFKAMRGYSALGDIPPTGLLADSLPYATACARLYYWYGSPEPLPQPDDVEGLARYWHRYWCRGCKGTPEQATANYRKLVLDVEAGE